VTLAGNQVTETDVAIVGGGIAGLVTGVALAEAGLKVTVFERDKILGGRAQSWKDGITGDPVHIGPHIFLSAYPNMLQFLDRLGTRGKLVWEENQLIKIVEGRTEIVGRTWRLPAPLHFLPSLFADKALSIGDRLSGIPVALLAMQLTEEDVLDLDSVNAYAFLRAMGVTSRYMERFWEPTCMYIMNAPVELCSAGSLLRFFRFLIGHSDYKIGFPDGGLGDTFAPHAHHRLEALGGQVLLRTEVEQLLQGSDGRVEGVKLTDGRVFRAKHYVSALPPKALLGVLPPAWLGRHETFRNLTAFHDCPYIAVYLWFDRKLTPLKFWARLFKPGDLNSDFYDLSNINRGWENRPSVITSNIIFSHRLGVMTDQQIIDATVREIADFLPEALEARVTHAVVNRIPMAVHCPFPGTERKRASALSPIENLVLAGDWTRTGLPASMESAARSGWLAAEEILSREGQHTTLAIQHSEAEGIARILHTTSNVLPVKSLLRRILGRDRAAA
jgi:squalene-associated FAD-dependent desaturase